MIQLDENHWVLTADEVKAIRPMFIPCPKPITDPERRAPIIDPERCMVLIGGDWIRIERGAQAIARTLSKESPNDES